MTTDQATARGSQQACRAACRWFRHGWSAAADLLFPPCCACCGDESEAAEGRPLFCAKCNAELAVSTEVACPRCALAYPETSLAAGDCFHCRGRKLPFRQARTIGPYQGPLRAAVLKMKHATYEPLALAAGQRLAEALTQRPLPARPDLVAAVPMHWLKRWWRGTNPAESVARAVARRLKLRFAAGLLVCRRYLRRQALLSPHERRQNVRGAFRASRRWKLAGQTILLVDDVMTTGATAEEASRVLLAAGAAEIFVATVARSSPDF